MDYQAIYSKIIDAYIKSDSEVLELLAVLTEEPRERIPEIQAAKKILDWCESKRDFPYITRNLRRYKYTEVQSKQLIWKLIHAGDLIRYPGYRVQTKERT